MPTPHAKKFREEKNTLEREIVRLAESGKIAKAGQKAVRAQQKRGLPTTFKQGTKIIRVHANGSVEVLAEIHPTPYTLPRGVKIIHGK